MPITNDELLRNSTRQPLGIFDTDPGTTLVLLLDFKESPDELDTWNLVQTHLQPLREKSYLTYWDNNSKKRVMRPITVVASGSASVELVNNLDTNKHQDIFLDAPLDKLESQTIYTQANSYYASVSLSMAVGSVYFHLSAAQLDTIARQTQSAKELGLLSRYWGIPGWPVKTRNTVWEQLILQDIGMLNVDALWTASMRDWRLCWVVGWKICA